MRIKNNIEFQCFNDGICSVKSIDSKNKEFIKYNRLRFENRKLGLMRFFEAQSYQMDIVKVIRIPRISCITTHDKIVIDDKTYKIKLIQELFDTNPQCVDLTLGKD